MELAFYDDLAAFRQHASPLLRSHCALNSLKLGILEHHRRHGEETAERVLALGIHGGRVIAAFVRARSLYFFADPAQQEAIIPCAVEEFRRRRIAIPGVMGHGDSARHFAEAWSRRMHCGVSLSGKDYLYEITSAGSAGPASGKLRLAGPSDAPRLQPLFRAYYLEDLGVARAGEELAQEIASFLAEGQVYLWEDGALRSMATAMLACADGVELANVYTPREYRRTGYAAACVLETCRALLTRYPRVVLFAGQDNGAANALYRRVGFHLVDEMVAYTFSE